MDVRAIAGLMFALLAARAGDAAPLLPRPVLASCDLAANAIAGTSAATIARSSGSLPEIVRDAAPVGCLVTMKGSFKAMGQGVSLDERLRHAFESHGFAAVIDYDADGPDGTRFGFRKGAIVCIVSEAWDGGDDGDPSYVPDDAFELTAGCSERPGPGVQPSGRP